METIVRNPYLFREIVRHLPIFDLEALGTIGDDFEKLLASSVFDEVKLEALTHWIRPFTPSTDLKKLLYLNLNNTQLTLLPDSLGQLSDLRVLSLRNNQLTSLQASIGELKTLQRLRLNHNQLTSLPESIGLLNNLEMLDLRENQLIMLPESIGLLKELREFQRSVFFTGVLSTPVKNDAALCNRKDFTPWKPS
jgi:hypothetical protein